MLTLYCKSKYTTLVANLLTLVEPRFYRVGGTTRISGFILAGATAALLFIGTGPIEFIRKCLRVYTGFSIVFSFILEQLSWSSVLSSLYWVLILSRKLFGIHDTVSIGALFSYFILESFTNCTSQFGVHHYRIHHGLYDCVGLCDWCPLRYHHEL